MNTALSPDEQDSSTPDSEDLCQLAVDALSEAKAQDVVVLDVRDKTSITDSMIVASGSSTRHVKTLAQKIVLAAKDAGCPPTGVEGERDAEWVLVDLGDVLIHVMLPRTRDFYNIEGLWAVQSGAERTGA